MKMYYINNQKKNLGYSDFEWVTEKVKKNVDSSCFLFHRVKKTEGQQRREPNFLKVLRSELSQPGP